MKRAELIKIKRLLQQEVIRRERINELLENNLIKEFMLLNNLNIKELCTTDIWSILDELLEQFQIEESNGILVCIGNYMVDCDITYQDTYHYTRSVPFNSLCTQYQTFRDIETCKLYTGYVDRYIETMLEQENSYYPKIQKTPSEFCRSRYGKCLVSELKEKYILLNPYNTKENENGFNEVRKVFFETTIENGQTKAKQLVLSKYSRMN